MTAAAGGPADERIMTVSERSPHALASRLETWLAGRLGAAARPVVSGVRIQRTSGLSSISVLFEADWTDTGTGSRRSGGYVARLAPEAAAIPVFPHYDLALQFDVIGQVAARSPVPVPPLRWNETDPAPLGSPFFVMDQVDGLIPLDNPPYVFAGWLPEAAPADRARLERASIEILAQVHAIADPVTAFPGLRPPEGVDTLRRHVDEQRAYYLWALAGDGIQVPIIERGLDWLSRHWPDEHGPDVLSWGDARIGNIVYRDFTPVAVLDWEMAALGPRELDVAWFIFLHRFFQDLARTYGLPGLPDLLRRADVERHYQEVSGQPLRNLDFYLVYAALRHAIVMARVKRRMIHFGEDQVPGDPDDYVLHRASLEHLLDGTYRWD